LTKELNISLDSEAIRNLVRVGIERTEKETQLEQTVEKLREEKNRLASIFQKTAVEWTKLEAKWVGTRNQFGRVSRDNRVLAMHLCSRTPKGKRESRIRDEMIQKYIMNYRNA
jgi:biopolymer transport protein ExbB/TolQ